MNKKYIIGLVAGLLLLAGGIALFLIQTVPSPNVVSDKIQVVASFYPLSFFSQQIGKDNINIINITPAGVEPHEYEPMPQDLIDISRSDLVVLNGQGLEPWADTIKQNSDSQKTVILEVGNNLATQTIVEDNVNVTDPHIWLNPLLAKQIADQISAALIRIDPGQKDFYLKNTQLLKEALDELDQDYKNGLQSCRQRNIITSHAAFGYLATAYGLSQVPISGLSADAEPSAQQLAQVVAFAKAHNITHIFFESLVSPELSNTIAREVGAQTLVLNPIEGLTLQEISAGENYFTAMQGNLANLKIALECSDGGK